MKNTKTAIKELTAMYRHVLLKCLAIAAGVLLTATSANAELSPEDKNEVITLITENAGNGTFNDGNSANATINGEIVQDRNLLFQTNSILYGMPEEFEDPNQTVYNWGTDGTLNLENVATTFQGASGELTADEATYGKGLVSIANTLTGSADEEGSVAEAKKAGTDAQAAAATAQATADTNAADIETLQNRVTATEKVNATQNTNIDANAAAIAQEVKDREAAIAQEVADRNAAIKSDAANADFSALGSYENNTIGKAIQDAAKIANDAASTASGASATAIAASTKAEAVEDKVDLLTADASTVGSIKNTVQTAINQEVTDRNTAISNAINQEVSDRNAAISDAITKEVADRNAAIEAATGEGSALDSRLDSAESDLTTLMGDKTVEGSVDQKIDSAITQEVSDRNAAINEAKTELKNYTDQAEADAVASAKSYTDTQVSALEDGQVKTNKEAIDILNGDKDVIGSVDNKVNALREEALQVFEEKEAWVGNTLGINTKEANAVNNAYAGAKTDGLKAATTLTGADLALDKAISDETATRLAEDDAIRKAFGEADNALQQQITDMDSAYKAADKDLSNRIDAVNNTLGDVAGLTGTNLAPINTPTPANEIDTPDLPEADAPLPEGGSGTSGETTTPTPTPSTTPTVADHLAALDTSIGDRRDLGSANAAINSAAQTSVASALQATGNALGDMDFSRTKYLRRSTSVTSALQALDSNLSRLNDKVSDMDREMRGGFASMAALSALQPNARAENNTQIAVGTGMYRDRIGGALGIFHYLNDNTMLNAGVSYGGSSSFTGRAGATFGW